MRQALVSVVYVVLGSCCTLLADGEELVYYEDILVESRIGADEACGPSGMCLLQDSRKLLTASAPAHGTQGLAGQRWCRSLPEKSFHAAAGTSILVALLLGSGLVASSTHSTPHDLAGGDLRVVMQTSDVRTDASRDCTIDNARALLSILIVMGHYVMLRRRTSSPMELAVDGVLERPFASVCSLPGLVFISGYLSRGKPTRRKLRTLFTMCALPCFLYSALLIPTFALFWSMTFDSPLDGARGLQGPPPWEVQEVLRSIVNAAPDVQWYLQCLVLWRLYAYALSSIAEKLTAPVWPMLIVSCVVTTLAQTYVSLPDIYSLRYAAFFFPCFVTGMLFPLEELMAKIPSTRAVRLVGIGLLLLWSFMVNVNQTMKALVFSAPFKDVRQWSETHGVCLTRMSWCDALFSALVGMVIFLIFLTMVCPRSDLWLTRYLRQGPMYVYLLHPITFLPLWFGLEEKFAYPAVGIGTAASVLEAVLLCAVQYMVCVAIALVLASPIVRAVFRPLLEPRWLADVILGPACSDVDKNIPSKV